MQEECYAKNCAWARFDGHAWHCAMPACQNTVKRAGEYAVCAEPFAAVMAAPPPCKTCAGCYHDTCRHKCGRYSRWFSARWNAVAEMLRRGR